MGITIHYRGKLDDLSRVEAIEDRLIDLTLALGGEVQVWRSMADVTPQDGAERRMVRGLILNLDPGQETLSLLFSPEGWLTPLWRIEEAEQGPFAEPPSCFVKTQFGSVVGHASVVELLSALRDEFLPQLEVTDESGYWDDRDPAKLAAAMERNAKAIDAFAAALDDSPLSSEAREDPEIVATRIERVARLVHQSFRQQEQDAAAQRDSEDSDEFCPGWSEQEAQWQRLHQESQARQHRMQRRIEERLLNGDTPEQALGAAHEEEFPGRNSRDQQSDGEKAADEPWLASLTDADLGEDISTPERDPLLARVSELLVRLMKQAERDDSPVAAALVRHACEICGGLSQVLPLPPPYDFDREERGLAVMQLKRALRGAAFLRGECFSLPASASGGLQRDQLRDEVEAIQGEIITLLKQARPMPND
jgi:hypothetical protein